VQLVKEYKPAPIEMNPIKSEVTKEEVKAQGAGASAADAISATAFQMEAAVSDSGGHASDRAHEEGNPEFGDQTVNSATTAAGANVGLSEVTQSAAAAEAAKAEEKKE
jgi:hypothetical protein